MAHDYWYKFVQLCIRVPSYFCNSNGKKLFVVPYFLKNFDTGSCCLHALNIANKMSSSLDFFHQIITALILNFFHI